MARAFPSVAPRGRTGDAAATSVGCGGEPCPAATVSAGDPALFNADLAPLPRSRRSWGWFEIFNVWSNDIQSLAG